MSVKNTRPTTTRTKYIFNGFQPGINYAQMYYNKRTNLDYSKCNEINSEKKRNKFLSQKQYLELLAIRQTLCPSGCNVLPFNKGSLNANLVTYMDLSGVVILAVTDPTSRGVDWGQPFDFPAYLDPSAAGNIWRRYWVDPNSNINGVGLCNTMVYTKFMKINPAVMDPNYNTPKPASPRFQGSLLTGINSITEPNQDVSPTPSIVNYYYDNGNMLGNFGNVVRWSKNVNGKCKIAISARANNTFAGGVYIYNWDDNSSPKYSFNTYISNPNPDEADLFGNDLQWSPNGNVLAVTAPYTSYNGGVNTNVGQVYLFKCYNGNFNNNPIPLIKSSGATSYLSSTYNGMNFGTSIAWHPNSDVIAVSGPLALVGANNNGQIFLFDNQGEPLNLRIITSGIDPSGAQVGMCLQWNPSRNRYILAAGAPKAKYSQNGETFAQNGSVILYFFEERTSWNVSRNQTITQSFNDYAYFGTSIYWSPDSANIAITTPGYYVPSNYNFKGKVFIFNISLPATTNAFTGIHPHVGDSVVNVPENYIFGTYLSWSPSPNGPILSVSVGSGISYPDFDKDAVDLNVYLYDTSGNLAQKITPPSILGGGNSLNFGFTTSWSPSGVYLAISSMIQGGEYGDGVVYIYNYNGEFNEEGYNQMSPNSLVPAIYNNEKVTNFEGLYTLFGSELEWSSTNLNLTIGSPLGNNSSGDVFIYE